MEEEEITFNANNESEQESKVQPFELYRKSTLGICLEEALDEMVNSSVISQDLRSKVLLHFDKAVNKALANTIQNRVVFKGHLHTYRYCDNVWTLILSDASFRIDNESICADKVKFVACDGKAFINSDVAK